MKIGAFNCRAVGWREIGPCLGDEEGGFAVLSVSPLPAAGVGEGGGGEWEGKVEGGGSASLYGDAGLVLLASWRCGVANFKWWGGREGGVGGLSNEQVER